MPLMVRHGGFFPTADVLVLGECGRLLFFEIQLRKIERQVERNLAILHHRFGPDA